ncbi:beta-lactamase family protein [Glycocaulis profundi]|nr:beta-lactamase family protein [Glycocaulis profundi]
MLFSFLLAGFAAAGLGMDDPRCQQALDYSAGERGVAVLVLQHGDVICEGYARGDSETAHELWSGTKSFLGIMAAAAVADGLLSLDEPAALTLTEWAGDADRDTITIRHLLSMTSGHAGTIGRPPSYEAALNAELMAAPGERFVYSPVPSQIFGEIMRRKLIAAGQDGDPVAYLRARVLEPAGIDIGGWRSGPDGHPLMPQGALMTARGWAAFGEFVRHSARSADTPLVDPDTFEELFDGSQANPAYGLSWWMARASSAADPATASSDLPAHHETLPDDLVFAAGAGDQRLFVVPSQGLVIVRLARLDVAALMAGERGNWSDYAFLSLWLDGVSTEDHGEAE